MLFELFELFAVWPMPLEVSFRTQELFDPFQPTLQFTKYASVELKLVLRSIESGLRVIKCQELAIQFDQCS